jgi:hypothetical protein
MHIPTLCHSPFSLAAPHFPGGGPAAPISRLGWASPVDLLVDNIVSPCLRMYQKYYFMSMVIKEVSMNTKTDLVTQGRMLTPKDVISMWNISRVALWRLTNSRNESKRIPSYKVGGKRLYKYDELMWYLDKQKATPGQSRQKKEKPNEAE